MFYYIVIKIGTFEVTSQYFAHFISISSLVLKMTNGLFGGCFGHFNMSHLRKGNEIELVTKRT